MNENITTPYKKTPREPQKPNIFSLKPSASTLISNERLSTRLSHMLFRQKPTQSTDTTEPPVERKPVNQEI